MLQIATAQNRNVRFIHGDFTDVNSLEHAYNVITAFRFLPNAELSLIKSSVSRMSDLLQDGGIVVVNNHRNLNSLSARIKRILRKKGGRVGCYDEIIEEEFLKHGFSKLQTFSISLFPMGYEPYEILKKPIRILETINYKFFSQYHRLGQNNIMIFKKTNG